MYIIAGLGNPGLSYSRTRHNIGFMALDALARRWGIRIHTRAFQGLVGEGLFEGEKVLLIKPQTYMNLSGSCLREVMGFYKLPPEKLIVLVDDVELPLGSLRIRSKGSAGTHNGLRSILSCLGSDNFVRIRIGCGQDQSLLLRDFVLKRPGKGEMALLEEAYAHAAEAAELIVSGHTDRAQMLFNKNMKPATGWKAAETHMMDALFALLEKDPAWKSLDTALKEAAARRRYSPARKGAACPCGEV